uniref:Uncharacterized protein n=1 Tax=uncultured Thiotrichaceae bacterium TaxID=298394 RepID=A0A6S6UEZ3_9GAMM|nr:MAG: Unknown protein [uncultured Thiotrichaceae bacterium]
MKKKVFLIQGLLLLCSAQTFAFDDVLYSTYPDIPSSYDTLNPGSMIGDARVNFGFDLMVDNTDGYQVISPDGEVFYVDDIEKPNCAFYATTVNVDEDDTIQSNLEIISNVYIEEVNFENCQ